MSRRTTRKTVDYSRFDADNDESDDDFQNSPNQPPAKKTKSKVKEKNKKESKRDMKQNNKSNEGQAKNIRKSRDEKQYEKELQMAMEISKSQSLQVIQIDDDEVVTDCQPMINENGRSEKSLLDSVDVNGKNHPDDCLIACNDGGEEAHTKDEVSDEFDPSDCYDDDYDDGDDDDDDDDFHADSDSEEEASKKKKRKTEVVKSKPKGENETVKSENKTTSKDKVSKSLSKSAKNTRAMKNTLQCKEGRKTGLKSPALPKTPILSTSAGKSTSQKRPSLCQRTNSSPGLGGVSINTSRPGGLRLGLSRNVRVSKPLHSNITIK